MFESITGWRYVDYNTKGYVVIRWVFFLPLALLLAGLCAGLIGGVFALLGIMLGSELPKTLTYSVGYLVCGYVFMMSGVKLAPRAKRIITFGLMGISMVCILSATNAALSFGRNYLVFGYIMSLVGSGVAFTRIAKKNYFMAAPIS